MGLKQIRLRKGSNELSEIKFGKFDNHDDHVNFMAFSLNDKLIASASSDKKVRA
jgi:hypothetical protein